MYLKYINNNAISRFVNSTFSPNTRIIIVEDCSERNYINVYTNLLDTTLHLNDFECINLDANKHYHKAWRKFVISELDSIDPSKKLGDKYINDLNKHLQKCDICKPLSEGKTL